MVNRVLVGARYGLNDWLIQRISGALIALYAIAVVIALAVLRPDTYAAWKALFSHGSTRVATFLIAITLALHAWVGMRDVLMDYVNRTAIRLTLYVLVIVYLASYVGWASHILWR